MSKMTLADQPLSTKLLFGVTAAMQLGLLAAAHWDISHRDDAELRGSKTKWRAITLINFVGPVWYFLRGRR